MGLRYLEHLLVMTHDPLATRNWWRDAFGLTEGPNPDFGFPVYWLYIGDQDVVHIAAAGGTAAQDAYLGNVHGGAGVAEGSATGSGRIDHICFNSEGVVEAFQRLDAIGAKYEERRAGTSPVYQVFVEEPINGLKVELNFPAAEAEAAGRTPAIQV